jgi:hypothetical protein
VSHPLFQEIRKKLDNVLGREKAQAIVTETLARVGLQDLSTPDECYRFGVSLMRRGGIFEAVGRSIKIQSILHGARDVEAA